MRSVAQRASEVGLLGAIAICLTVLGTAYKRLEIDASAFGFPYPWLIRFPPGMTDLDEAFYFYRWWNLFLNFGIYFVMVLTLRLIFGMLFHRDKRAAG